MKEQFEQFLKKHRAYRKYFKNLTVPYEDILKENPHDYIYAAFVCSASPEGFEYWKKLRIKWDAIINFNN